MDRTEIFAYAKDQYRALPEYLFSRTPDTAVLRHKGGGKWFGAVLFVPPGKFGLVGDGTVDVLNIKCDPLLSGSFRQQEGIYPGYHMNKEHWLSVVLNSSVPRETIFSLIDMSYALTK